MDGDWSYDKNLLRLICEITDRLDALERLHPCRAGMEDYDLRRHWRRSSGYCCGLIPERRSGVERRKTTCGRRAYDTTGAVSVGMCVANRRYGVDRRKG